MDTNWFFSACAQTSGAIVAVVGGFIASRLVSLSAERNGLGNRLKEINQNLSSLRADRDAAEDRLRRFNEKEVREAVVSATLWARHKSIPLDLDALKLEHEEACRQLGEAAVQRIVDETTRDTDAASDYLEPIVPANCYLELTEIVNSLDLDQVSIPRDTVQTVFSFLAERRRDLPSVGYGVAAFGTSRMEIAARKRLALESALDRTTSECRQYQGISEEVETQLARVGHPTGMKTLFFPLFYLTVSGIILPLSLLLVNGGKSSQLVAGLVLGLFALGVACVLGAIASEWRRLGRPMNLPTHDTSIEESGRGDSASH